MIGKMGEEAKWVELALQICAWAIRNYGPTTKPWQMVAGMVEEVGEYFEHKQNGNREGMVDSLGDQAIYAAHLCFLTDTKFPVLEEELETVRSSERTYMLKLIQVMGIGSRAVLKSSQGIRGYSWDYKSAKSQESLNIFLTGWRRWTDREIVTLGMPGLLEITGKVWEGVRTRDWRTNPENGTTG